MTPETAVPGVTEEVLAELDRRLGPVDDARAAAYPGERSTRQPVHTCYVPADAVVPGVTGHLAATRDPEEFADLVEAADRLPSWDVPGWLRRFSPEVSTDILERVLRRTTGKK